MSSPDTQCGASPSANSACVLDHNKYAELSQLLGKEKFDVAVRKFAADLDARVAEVVAPTTSQTDKISHAHKLVGTAGAIGFQELSEESRRVEEALKQGAGDVDRLIADFAAAAARAKAALDGMK